MRPRFELILITDGAPALLARLSRLAPALNEHVAILLRDKQAPREELLRQARALRELTRAQGAALLISQHVDVALACDADGVQLPEAASGPHAQPGALPTTLVGSRADPRASTLQAARATLGTRRLLGVSRHDLAGLSSAERAGADYATLSPIFASPGKGEPLGLAAFADAVRATSLPLFALGGVATEQVPALRAAGAAGVAVIREVLAAEDPLRALGALVRALSSARSS